jgi:hypothetical protein
MLAAGHRDNMRLPTTHNVNPTQETAFVQRKSGKFDAFP